MSPHEREIRADELQRENRKLREALECVCETLSGDPESPTPEAAIKIQYRLSKEQGITPVWEREGYDSKEAWLADKE